jgi:hypothetical protein
MVVSWTPLFVLFDLGLPAGRHKPVVKIATMSFPMAADRKNPFPGHLPNRMVFPAFTGSSSARERRVPDLRCVKREPAPPAGRLIMLARGTMMA